MKFSPEKLLRSRNSVVKLVFENFHPFMVKIRVNDHFFVVSEVKIGPKIGFFKSHEILTGEAFEVEEFSGEVSFRKFLPLHAEIWGGKLGSEISFFSRHMKI